MGTLFVDKLDPQSGTSLEIGSSGDTITIPSGATITNSGTATGFGETNTPIFAARRTSAQSISNGNWTKIELATEDIDTDSAYDNSSNYRFTVPSGKQGKYLISFNISVASSSGVSNAKQLFVALYKNGSAYLKTIHDGRNNAYGDTFFGSASYILDLSASDYVELYAKFHDAGGSSGTVQSEATSFSGVRLASS